jgi:hypothetical protein
MTAKTERYGPYLHEWRLSRPCPLLERAAEALRGGKE